MFDSAKIILINRASDKIYSLIQDLIERNINNTKIIINAGALDARSKLRSLFEKNKNLVCIPTYPDNNNTLIKLTSTFLRKENISISQENINLIVEKCNGDRNNLKNELYKIKNFAKRKKVSSQEIIKLVNLMKILGYLK